MGKGAEFSFFLDLLADKNVEKKGDVALNSFNNYRVLELYVEILDSGMNAIFYKPYDCSEFLSVIANYLKNEGLN